MAGDTKPRPPDLAILEQAAEDRTIDTYEFKVITPIFGGSATAQKVDLHRPIRGQEIRGMLRAWWRLLRAGEFESSARMFEREAELFGSTDSPSPFDVIPTPTNHGKPYNVQVSQNSPLSYGIYPFCQTKDDGIDAGLEFSLTLRWKRDTHGRDEVKSALKAWSVLGGYGSRTRRGCGSLALVSPEATLAQVRGNVHKGVPSHGTTVLSGGVAMLGPSGHESGMAAWQDALAVYRGFRKGEDRNGEYDRSVKNAAKALLNPPTGDRMSSPVLTKPLPDGDTYRPMIVILTNKHTRSRSDEVIALKSHVSDWWGKELEEVTFP